MYNNVKLFTNSSGVFERKDLAALKESSFEDIV